MGRDLKMKSTMLYLVMTGLGTLSAQAQGLPTSQPNLLQIMREEVKLGHADVHVKTETGWPAAFEKAKSPNYYLALVSLTGTNEVWFVSPFNSHAAMAESMKQETEDPVLAAELTRLTRADADHLTGFRTIHAMGRKDLSHGEFPDTSKARFYEITLFRVRPGHEMGFEAAAKAYGQAAGRIAPDSSFRVYQVVAGMPGPAFLVFGSVQSFADYDKIALARQQIMKGFTDEERSVLQKFGAEALINQETNRFRLDPEMSYVSKEVRKQDPEFWSPKKPAPKPKTATQQ